MIPASIIAAHLHLPLYALKGRAMGVLGTGAARVGYGDLLAVVDDTTYFSNAMDRRSICSCIITRDHLRSRHSALSSDRDFPVVVWRLM